MTGAFATVELACHACGYDLRAHPPDGTCPECGASVAEARRMAAIPKLPRWRESDPRWRRRVLLGVWLLLLLVPLMDVMQSFGWDSRVSIPNLLGFPATVRTLDETLLWERAVRIYQPIVFCIGIVMLFARERGRRPLKLDWTRRWGVLCSYVVALLSIAQVFFLVALVMAGIAALFHSMPGGNQPGVTRLFVVLSTTYLHYGPQPMDRAGVVLVAFSSITMLLACVQLFDALRRSGPRRYAVTLLAPLALFALVHLWRAGRSYLSLGGRNFPTANPGILQYQWYFWPPDLVSAAIDLPRATLLPPNFGIGDLMEVAKWWALLAIAVWLTAAQVAAHRGPALARSPSGTADPAER
jgi:hypothetical protein